MAAEVIAFDSGKQSSYVKAVKKIKKTIASEAEQKELDGGHKRGIILISHLPHGFFENELSGFFGQFGVVTKVRVARSKRTGRSKGYAFVEFEFEEVAQIAAESMNNYLMFERLVKCEVLKGKIHARKIFAGEDYGKNNFPKLVHRNQFKEKLAKPQGEEELQKVLQARLANVEKRNKKLAELGINYEFKPKPKGRQVPESPASKKQMRVEEESNAKRKSDSKPKFSPKLLRSRTRETGVSPLYQKGLPQKVPRRKSTANLPPPESSKTSRRKSTANLLPPESPKTPRRKSTANLLPAKASRRKSTVN